MVDFELPDPSADELEVEIVSIGDEAIESDSGAGHRAAGDALPAEESERRLAEKLGEAEEKYLRLRAEFDNFRKRLEREREERERRALAAAFLDLLPVVDNLERAAGAKGSADDLRKGVELVARQLVEILRRFGLVEIPAVGQPFDPRLHEAVAREESAEHEVPTVIAELQRGYWLNERLLRPAMVKVALPVDSRAESGAPGGEPPSSLEENGESS
jgi:molecular chaperone GrpE